MLAVQAAEPAIPRSTRRDRDMGDKLSPHAVAAARDEADDCDGYRTVVWD